MKIYAIFIVCVFILGCGAMQTASPSATFKKYVEAYDRKDVAAMKQTFSKGTMKMYEDAAQRKQISADEVIKGQFDAALGGNLTSKVEIVSEKIEGDTATLEVKSQGASENEKLPMVKEDGEWKIAFDQYMQAVIEKMKQDMNKMPTSTDQNK